MRPSPQVALHNFQPMNLDAPLTTYEECRAYVNRFNAQRSTGPRTTEGKARSSQNALKHGIYSKQLIREGEDPAEFEQLRTALRSEHQPANTTEEILVDELVHHFWRLRRFREMEGRAWQPDAVATAIDNGLLTLLARTVASAERGFFRALAALTKLQKLRGFVPQKTHIEQEPAPTTESDLTEAHTDPRHETPCDNATHDETHLFHPPSAPRSPRRIPRTPSRRVA